MMLIQCDKSRIFGCSIDKVLNRELLSKSPTYYNIIKSILPTLIFLPILW